MSVSFKLYIGGPGTGKSTKLCELIYERSEPCHIFAPTWYCANKING